MRRSDRVALIKKISARLAEFDWNEVDMTFRQFGVPWSEIWNGTLYSYSLAQVEKVDDATLTELHEHLFGKEFGGAVDEALGSWVAGRFRLFLSHVSADKIHVAAIKAQLAAFGIDGFVAHEDIDPTKEWIREIEVALASCDALIPFMTPSFHDSVWTDQEVGYCLRRRILIVPIRAGRDPYGFIGKYQAIAGVGKTAEELAETIFEVLIGHELTSAAMSAALVSNFEDSSSFADARRTVGLLRRVTQWTPALLQRIEAAIQQNGQIESAWGVPGQVRSIVEQHRQ